MHNKIRTFIAIDTPPDFKIRAEELQNELDSVNAPVRWEKSYKLHMTLKFLGDTEMERIDKIGSVLEDIASRHRPFWLRYHGLGCFPNRKNPRIIWIGCNPLSSEFDHIRENIEKGMADLGFEMESRPFHPHITIGRVKIRSGKDKRAIPDLIKKLENLTFDALENEVQSILLMKSELHREGSVYSILKQISLTS
jgi:RNA 2',3'-cyclic 3'-phosphodiesterase